MSKTYGLLVTHNEADRYLQSVLEHNRPLFDDLLIFDDRSTDTTRVMAAPFGTVVERPEDAVSFSEHEGRFRALAWHYLAHEFQPEYGDAIIAFDADEYLLGDPNDFDTAAARVAVDECWDVKDGIPKVRYDRSWGRIDDVRAWRWQLGLNNEAENHLVRGKVGRNKRDAEFGQTASGSGPYMNTREWHRSLRILHVGYLDPEDRLVKQARYRNDGRHGSAHIDSITARPRLRSLGHPIDIRRGS